MAKKKDKKEPVNVWKELLEWVLYIILAMAIAAVLNVFVFQMTRVDGNSMVPTLAHNDLYVISKLGNLFNNCPKQGDIVVVDSRLLYLTDKEGKPMKNSTGDTVYFSAEDAGDGTFYLLQTDTYTVPTDSSGNPLVMTKDENNNYVLQENDLAAGVKMHRRTLGLDFYEVFRYNAITKLFTGDTIGHAYYVKRVIGVPGDVLEFDAENGTVTRNGELLDEPYINDEFPVYRDMTVTVDEGYVFVMGDNRNNSKDSRMIGQVPIENVLGKLIFKVIPGKGK